MTLSARAGVSPSRINQLGSPEAPRPGDLHTAAARLAAAAQAEDDTLATTATPRKAFGRAAATRGVGAQQRQAASVLPRLVEAREKARRTRLAG